MQTKQNTRKLLALFLSLAMVFSMVAGLGVTASAASAPATDAPPTIGADTHITSGGSYQLDPGAINGVIYLETSDAVTLVGNGTLQTSTPNTALTIDAKIAGTAPNTGANLILQDVYASSPYSGGNVIDFRGAGNTLSVASGSSAILESNGYNNAAAVHVGKGSALTITGTSTSNLYLYKSSGSAAIGGNTTEACGAITFASGNTFAKGTQTGATIGGDDTTGTINDDITISGGILCVETNARGAAIGASNQGQCAGNVYITGGSTLINVDFSGSAIGRGDSGTTTGNLFISGGSLKVVIDPNAGGNWPGGAGVNNSAITATINYGTPVNPQHGNVAEVSVSSLDISGNLTAVFNPNGQSPAVVYNQVGLNQYDYNASQTYTPENWKANPDNTNLYLYGPEGTTGYIAVSDSTASGTQNYSYTSSTPSPSSYFTLASTANKIVSFFADNATVTVGAAQVNYATVAPNGNLTFTVAANTGFTVTGVSDNGAPIGAAAGTYTLSNVTTNHRIVVTTSPQVTYNVTFTGANATVYDTDGNIITSATIDAGGTLPFSVVPASGYGIANVAASNGTVTNLGGGNYQLGGVTADTTVTITAEQIYNVAFSGGSDQVRVNGVSTTTSTILNNGTLNFTIVPDLGYELDTTNPPTASSGTVTANPDGSYTLSGVNANTTVAITTKGSANYWTSATPGTWGGSGTSAAPYTISNAAGLAKLLQDVNSGISYSGNYFILTNDIDLSGGNLWAPIGGGRDLITTTGVIPTPVASSNYFAGSFDGNGKAISGMTLTIPAANSGSGAYGLFGYVNDGTIMNLSVFGTVTSDQDIDAVGGIVGYAGYTATQGTLFRLSNAAAISLTNSSVSETGGIAGVLANFSTGTVTISESANIAPITGRSRLGGVVGAAYSSGSAVTVSMCFNKGNITADDSSGRSYVGGVVGYSMGAINDSYNQGNIVTGTGDIYAGGIAGLLNGASSPNGSISDSYNTGLVSGSGISLQALFGYADNSPRVQVSDSGFLDNMAQDQLGATLSNVWHQSQQFMQSQSVLGGTYLSTTFFTQFSADYPILRPQVLTISSGDVDDFANALDALTVAVNTIVINSLPISISGAVTIDIAPVDGRIYRAPGSIVDMIAVASGGALTITSGVIDGNTEAAGVTGSIISVSGGTLTLNGGTLQNNSTTGNGGAIFINVGSVTMTGGTITGNTATLGNGIYVTASNQLTLSPSGSNTITFGTSNNIYLPGGVSFIIGADLGVGVNGTIGLTFGSPNEGDLVATASDQTMAGNSVVKLVPAGTVVLDVDGSDILIAGVR
ncbi:MAG: hypothetical protein LBK23_04510 [Oscillospiraceae bacterium]|nr:hypothetical protein [Oscillospiraceae bacterium]